MKIVTCLWFTDDAEEAVRFYRSLFEGSKQLDEMRWGPGGPMPEGTLISATLELAGQQLIVLNGNPRRGFTEAASLMIRCGSQAEIDTLWAKLGEGGEPGQCGWLKDRFGVSWQVIPAELGDLLREPDPAKRGRIFAAMFAMKKLDVARLKQARDGR